MNPMISPRHAGQAPVIVRGAAVLLAVLMNVLTLAGIQHLANPDHVDTAWAQRQAAVHKG